MKKQEKLAFAKELNDTGAVDFMYMGFKYSIYESMANEGYMVDVYEEEDYDDDTEAIDGGLCTGNAFDAVGFLLPQLGDEDVWVWVVSITEDYSLEGQWVFALEGDAVAKYNKEVGEYFEDDWKEAIAEGIIPADTPLSDYQHSDAWWDYDTRVRVHMEMVGIE